MQGMPEENEDGHGKTDQAVNDWVSVAICVSHPGQGRGIVSPDFEDMAPDEGDHGLGSSQGQDDVDDDANELQGVDVEATAS
jgi:hypothetical protein